jgi:type I restriction enzyme, S subunit
VTIAWPSASRVDSQESWLSELPRRWRSGRLKDIATATPSTVDKKNHEGETPVRLCNYVDVYYNDEITPALNFMESTASNTEVANYSVRSGEVVITKDSETATDIGIAAYVPQDIPGVVYGYHLSILRALKNADGRFIKRLFDSQIVKDQLATRANGLTRVGLGQGALTSVRVPIPPLEEQRRIAGYLDRETCKIDTLIAKQEQLVATLTERRQSVITQGVTKGLNRAVPVRRIAAPWVSEIPAGWVAGNIRYFASMKTGHTPSRSEPSYWENTSIPWFTLADVWQLRAGAKFMGETTQQISPLGLANSAADLLPAGTVVLSRTASVGFAGIMPRPMATSQDYWNWVPGDALRSEYLWYQLQAMRPHLMSLMHGSTHNTIYQADAAGLWIVVPPVDEQMAIVSFLNAELENAKALIDNATRMIEVLRERRQALISAAVTGKIDVRDL